MGVWLETHKHAVGESLNESLEHQRAQVVLFHEILALVENKDVHLEEFIRGMILDPLRI